MHLTCWEIKTTAKPGLFWFLEQKITVGSFRVFETYHFEGGKLPPSIGIGELIHLRFLSLHEAGVSHLPSSLRTLKLLLCLNLNVADLLHLVHVPDVLKEMQELRYPLLPRSMHDKTKLKLGWSSEPRVLNKFLNQTQSRDRPPPYDQAQSSQCELQRRLHFPHPLLISS
ncbi:hypothetical protein Rs2_36165 [Raphanus sativus]|nr:hypothetical protein Rs2_36165 [Raphanus sativus]